MNRVEAPRFLMVSTWSLRLVSPDEYRYFTCHGEPIGPLYSFGSDPAYALIQALSQMASYGLSDGTNVHTALRNAAMKQLAKVATLEAKRLRNAEQNHNCIDAIHSAGQYCPAFAAGSADSTAGNGR